MAFKMNDEIFFDDAFLVLRNTKGRFFLIWQEEKRATHPYGWSGPMLYGVFDIEKNLKDVSSVTDFSTLCCTPPSPRHRLQLWLRYEDATEEGNHVYSAKCVFNVKAPTDKEIADYRYWRKVGEPLYTLNRAKK